MTRLIADRYCLCGPREACDLATGAMLPVDEIDRILGVEPHPPAAS